MAGVDSLPEMIARAQRETPDLELRVCNALDMAFTVEFDVVFSNAVSHWNADHDLLPADIHQRRCILATCLSVNAGPEAISWSSSAPWPPVLPGAAVLRRGDSRKEC